MSLGNREAAHARRSLSADLEPHRAYADVRVQLSAAELFYVLDGDDPLAAEWHVEGHIGRGPARQRRGVHGGGQHASGGLDGELRRTWTHVPNLRVERAGAGRRRRINQRARGCQEGQREAEGDGPQHGVMVASARKAQGTTSLGSLEAVHCQVVIADLHVEPTSSAGKCFDTIETTIDAATQPVEPAHAKDVILPERQVQRHIGSHPGGHRLRPGGSLERPGGRHDGDLRRLPCRVSYLGLDRRRASWHRRRLDQRARRGQERQRHAEGDGPQHRDSIACR